jgi:hypothetical protein
MRSIKGKENDVDMTLNSESEIKAHYMDENNFEAYYSFWFSDELNENVDKSSNASVLPISETQTVLDTVESNENEQSDSICQIGRRKKFVELKYSCQRKYICEFHQLFVQVCNERGYSDEEDVKSICTLLVNKVHGIKSEINASIDESISSVLSIIFRREEINHKYKIFSKEQKKIVLNIWSEAYDKLNPTSRLLVKHLKEYTLEKNRSNRPHCLEQIEWGRWINL